MADAAALLARVIEVSNSTTEIERRLEAIVRLLADELALDACAIFSLDRAKEQLTLRLLTGAPAPAEPLRVPVSGPGGGAGGLVGLAAARREPVVVGDTTAPWHDLADPCLGLPADWRVFASAAAVPIVDDTFSYGVLLALRREPGPLPDRDVRLLAIVTREIAGAIRNAQLYFEAKKMVGELTTLYEIGKACSSTLELNELLALIVRTSVKIIRARAAVLRLLDEASGELKVTADYGLLDVPGARDPIKVGEGIAGEVAVTGLPILVKDARNDPRVLDRGRQIVSSILCVPLTFKGRVIGTLSLFDKEGDASVRERGFDEDDRYLLSTMASQIANAIGNAVVFNRMETLARDLELKNRELSILYEVGQAMMTTIQRDRLLHTILTAVTIGDGLGFNRAFLFLHNEAEGTVDGILGVGPESAEEAGAVWHRLASERRTLGDLVRNEDFEVSLDTRLNRTVQSIRIPMTDESNVLVRTLLDKQGHNVPDARRDPGVPDWLADKLDLAAFATVPLLAKGRALGVILVDNRFNRRPITNEDLRFLLMFANQAGLAVESATLYRNLEIANREQRAMHQRLVQNEKLAALGEMAAQVAHEIRNPLVSIGGFARRLHKRIGEDSPDRVYTEIILKEVSRLERILNEILAFSKEHRSTAYEPQSLEAIVDSTLQMMAEAFKENGVRVVKRFDPGLPPIVCDGTQIRQVFVNLFNNAREAMGKGGTLTVRLTSADGRGLGPHLVAEVEDTGGGLAEPVMDHIFRPFYTTKESGTGLGLAIVKRIVQNHAGSIEVANRPGHGVTFILRLPLRPDQQASGETPAEPAAAVGGS
ncbi:MAG TPA: GAF domain-containing protein [Thermodesulfobacteriota bacterium]